MLLHEKEMIMAKRKTGSSKAPHKPSSSTPPPLPPSMDRRGFEKTLADLALLMSEQNFESIDEANAFLQQYMMAGGIPPQRARTPLEEAQDIMYEAWQATDGGALTWRVRASPSRPTAQMRMFSRPRRPPAALSRPGYSMRKASRQASAPPLCRPAPVARVTR